MSSMSLGRIIGVFLLLQVIAGMSVNLFLTAPLFGSPGFVTNGAVYAQQIGFAVLIGLFASGLSLAYSIMAFPVFRATSLALATALIALSAVGLAVSAVENINMMSMVSFSEAFSKAGADEQAVLETARVIVAGARNWAHYIGLVLSGVTLLVFYTVLYRSRLVPRFFAVLGIVAVVLQLASVSLPLLGGEVVFLMLAPLGLAQILLSIWLLVKGFTQTETAPV